MMTETEDNNDDHEYGGVSKTSEGNEPSTPPRLHPMDLFGTPNTVVLGEQEDEENMTFDDEETKVSPNTSEIIFPDELSTAHTSRSEKEVTSPLSEDEFLKRFCSRKGQEKEFNNSQQEEDEFQKKLFREWKGHEKEPSVFKVLYEKYKTRYENDDVLRKEEDVFQKKLFREWKGQENEPSVFKVLYEKYKTRYENDDVLQEEDVLPLLDKRILNDLRKEYDGARRDLQKEGKRQFHEWSIFKILRGSFKMKHGDFMLPCDTYSLFVFAPYNSRGRDCSFSVIGIALVVFVFQLGILILLIFGGGLFYWDIVRQTPSEIGIVVRISQVLALLISVVQQEEFLQAINAISVFWKYRKNSSLLFKPFYENYIFGTSNSDRFTLTLGWWVAIVFRLVISISILYTTFLLVLTEDSVRDIVLNFSAIQVISTVDNSVFQLASWGYFGKELEGLADMIENTETNLAELKDEDEESTETDDARNSFCSWRFQVLIVQFFILLGFWINVVKKQENGDNFCQTLFVQFGDQNSPELAGFSGYYDLQLKKILDRKKVNNRAVYVASHQWKDKDVALFGYDENTDSWSFANNNNGFYLKTLDLNNIDWALRSIDDSKTYNLLDVAASGWVSRTTSSSIARTKESRPLPLQYFEMECLYKHEKCFNGAKWNKDDGMCECVKGWWGVQCELQAPCEIIEIDPQYGEFSGIKKWSTKYYNVFKYPTVQTSVLYGRPVFVGNRVDEGHFDLLFFTGRRWILTSTELLKDWDVSKHYSSNVTLRSNIPDMSKQNKLQSVAFNATRLQSVANYLVNDFHAYWSTYSMAFVSQPMDITSVNNAASPEHLGWYHAKRGKTVVQPNSNRPSNAVLLCATCKKDTNPCFYNNICNDDGKCNCTNTGSSGALCQIAPSDNGVCNIYFNKHEFAYDGGDCCEATCVQPNCPKKGGIHYNCNDPDWECEDPAVTCFKENFNEIFGECANGESGRAVALSDNSQDALYLAIGEPGCDGVRVYDTTTREQRGQWIQGPLDSSFGDSVALSDDANVLAIGAPGDHGGNGTVWIYNWIEKHKKWVVGFQGTGEERDSRLGESLDLSDNGDKLVVATSMKINIWTKGANNNWTPTEKAFADLLEGTVQKGKALSISSDAQFIAVATTINGVNSARIYKEDNGTYSKYGQTLNDRMSVIISGNARVLVASDSSQTFAYYRNESSRKWDSIDVNDAETFIKTAPVALSKDGNTLVVDTDLDDGDENFLVYLLQVPNNTGTNPSISFQDVKFEALEASNAIPSGEGRYAALSYIETGEIVIAVGDPLASNTTGKTSMYSAQAGSITPMKPRKPPKLCHDINIIIHTDAYPQETTWDIVTVFAGELLKSGGPYQDQASQQIETVCIPNDYCYLFTIRDAHTDGLVCTSQTGKYSLQWEGGPVIRNSSGNFSMSETTLICPSNMTHMNIPSPPADCSDTCETGKKPFRLFLQAGKANNETSWEFVNKISKKSNHSAGGGYSMSDSCYVYHECIRNVDCMEFTIKDSGDNGIASNGGYVLYLDEKVVPKLSGPFQFHQSHDINCKSCPSTTAGEEEVPIVLEVAITTDDQPEKINWVLVDNQNITLLERDQYEKKHHAKIDAKQLCHEPSRRLRLFENGRKTLAKTNCNDKCWTFTLYHAPSNENNSVGLYEVKWNGNVAAIGTFSNLTYDTECICDPKASLPPSKTFSNIPSVSPSLLPSGLPSLLPSMSPSHSPTLSPSDVPIDMPSSDSPTGTPSDYPTLSPSHFPSDLPTYTPSDFPTVPPSENPSDSPSVVPTLSPTPRCKYLREGNFTNIIMLDGETLEVGECTQVSTNLRLSQEANGSLALKDTSNNNSIWTSTTKLCGAPPDRNASYYTALQKDGNWITWEDHCLKTAQDRDPCVVWKSGKNDNATTSTHFVKWVTNSILILQGDPPNATIIHWNSSKDTENTCPPETK